MLDITIKIPDELAGALKRAGAALSFTPEQLVLRCLTQNDFFGRLVHDYPSAEVLAEKKKIADAQAVIAQAVSTDAIEVSAKEGE